MDKLEKIERYTRIARDIAIIISVLSITFWILFVDDYYYEDIEYTPENERIEENIS